MIHCRSHPEKLAEYRCPTCENRPMCEECKQAHEAGTKHVLENFKEVGPAIMHQCYKDGLLANIMDERLIQIVKEFEAGLPQEIGRLQSNCMQTEERCSKVQKLDSERRYAELYCYAKSLTAGSAKSQAVTGELSKHLLEMFDNASKKLKKALDGTVAQCKPVFDAYKEDEVFGVNYEAYRVEEQVLSTLKHVNMSKLKAAYIQLWPGVGDRVVSGFASRLQTHPMSALYLSSWDISDAGVEVLVQAAFRGKSLSAFCIESDNISDTGAKAVAAAARNYRSLTTFYLFGLKISDSGATAVAEAVKGCPLSVFRLGGYKISDSGATVVAETVKDCPLSVFCFGNCGISDAGAIAVAKTMKDCPLSAFCLMGGEISDSGATTVAEILSSGECASTLSALCLGSGSISDSGAKRVADAVRDCTRLSAFYLHGGPISGETLAYILEGMTDTSNVRSVNLCVDEISQEQMNFCLSRVRKSGVANQLKLRLVCANEAAKSVCMEFAAEWKATLAEFEVATDISAIFNYDVLIGVPK